MSFAVRPVAAGGFADIAALFGENGANSGCWCTWWRLSNKDWHAAAKAGRRALLEGAVCSGEPVGLLAYAGDGSPVGWVSVAPRGAYPRIEKSRTLRPADPHEPGVWSVTCFFIHRDHRRSGVAHALLAGAVRLAKQHGASTVEGYPVDTAGARRAAGDLFTGTVGLFTRAGFTEHARPATGSRVVMRRRLTGSR
jgi:GNAT superfamily N-acetyltransferase